MRLRRPLRNQRLARLHGRLGGSGGVLGGNPVLELTNHRLWEVQDGEPRPCVDDEEDDARHDSAPRESRKGEADTLKVLGADDLHAADDEGHDGEAKVLRSGGEAVRRSNDLLVDHQRDGGPEGGRVKGVGEPHEDEAHQRRDGGEAEQEVDAGDDEGGGQAEHCAHADAVDEGSEEGRDEAGGGVGDGHVIVCGAGGDGGPASHDEVGGDVVEGQDRAVGGHAGDGEDPEGEGEAQHGAEVHLLVVAGAVVVLDCCHCSQLGGVDAVGGGVRWSGRAEERARLGLVAPREHEARCAPRVVLGRRCGLVGGALALCQGPARGSAVVLEHDGGAPVDDENGDGAGEARQADERPGPEGEGQAGALGDGR
mmetsp:Transcript_23049/g.87145  ORF Transcript_23049/g.87145 Transcript_23049/m.87145 type:complete len:368 (-) Transcript_23049:580-1683(-)